MKNQSKLILYVIGGLLLTALTYFLLVQPGLKRISRLTEEERSTRSEVQRLEKQIQAYLVAQSDLSKATNKGLLEHTILTDKTLNIVIEEMEAASQATSSTHQLKIKRENLNSSPQVARRAGEQAETVKITAQNTLEEVPYTLSVQNSNYVNLVYFFQYLEHLPHFTEISGIDISIQKTEGGSDILTAVLDGVFLAQKNEVTDPNPQN